MITIWASSSIFQLKTRSSQPHTNPKVRTHRLFQLFRTIKSQSFSHTTAVPTHTFPETKLTWEHAHTFTQRLCESCVHRGSMCSSGKGRCRFIQNNQLYKKTKQKALKHTHQLYLRGPTGYCRQQPWCGTHGLQIQILLKLTLVWRLQSAKSTYFSDT